MPEMDSTDTPCKSDKFIDVCQFRTLLKHFIDLRRYKTALFWAEKVVVLTNDPNDVYMMAQCMFLLKEYHRAAHVIKERGLEKTEIMCHLLAAECMFEAKEYQEALDLLSNLDVDDMSMSMAGKFNVSDYAVSVQNEVLASHCFLKGRILEAMDNRNWAMDSYVQALHKSVYCTEALDALVANEMLKSHEEKALLEHLPFGSQCTEAEAEILKKLYESKLKKYYQHPDQILPGLANTSVLNIINTATNVVEQRLGKEFDISKVVSGKVSPGGYMLNELKEVDGFSIQTSLSRSSVANETMRRSSTSQSQREIIRDPMVMPLNVTTVLNRLHSSVDIAASVAERHFYNCEYRKSLKLLDGILKIDPYHSNALTVLIDCLAELKEFNKLFYWAHKLVNLYPEQAISWYAVGCYYDVIGKSDPARRYLSKATTLDRLFGPAWLAFGHSFAKENEHDQAMAAYFKATQLMRGCHLPLLYIGVECGLTKNLELAEKFFLQAMVIAPYDVHVLHELGCIKFEHEFYEMAEDIFRDTLRIVTKMAESNGEPISDHWEPLFNNLGHICRKNKRYDEALVFHRQSLLLKPKRATTYTAIGFVQAIQGNLADAIESFHKSLALKRDDVVTSTILKNCLDEFEEICDLDSYSHIENEEFSSSNAMKTPAKKQGVKLSFGSDAELMSPDGSNYMDMTMEM